MTAIAARTAMIRLPLPPSAVSPNVRAHFGTKAKAVAEYRKAAAWAAVALMNQKQAAPMQRAQLVIRYVICPSLPIYNIGRYLPKDQDNAQAACKAAIDGIVRDGHLLPDDNATRLTTTTRLDRHRKGKCAPDCGGSRVEFVFTEVLP